jgi:hypothetical protein
MSTPNSAGWPVTLQSETAKAEVGKRLRTAIAKNRMLVSREDGVRAVDDLCATGTTIDLNQDGKPMRIFVTAVSGWRAKSLDQPDRPALDEIVGSSD